MMKDLPLSLTLALWVVGPTWLIGAIALASGASWHIPAAAFALGVIAAAAEWLARKAGTSDVVAFSSREPVSTSLENAL